MIDTAELYLQFGVDRSAGEGDKTVVMIVANVPSLHLIVQGRTLDEVMTRLEIALDSKLKAMTDD